jgi:hypothetical protein
MDLTDEQWTRLNPLIPEPSRREDGRGRPSIWSAANSRYGGAWNR